MNLLIKKAVLIDSKSKFHKQSVSILIENGKISKIDKTISNPNKFQELELENLHVSEGWFDSSVCFGEPGFEERETIENGLKVAAKSGFTAVALQPKTNPVLDNQSQISFVNAKATGNAVDLFPIGALTKNSEGNDLAELFDMKNAGAIAFGDYAKNIDNSNVMKIALQYTQDFEGLICAFSEDKFIKVNGVVNESEATIQLGLKGIPNLAEELMIARNIELLEYTGGKLHIPTISTAKSVELIKNAKKKGLQISCSVAVHHLVLNDSVLENFDTNYKVSPPLRTEKDRKALMKGLQDGTIDMITSDHCPIDIEHKKVEFDLAKNGTIGLETAFSALNSVLDLEIIIEKLTSGRKTFGLEENAIELGQKANLSFFTTDEKWTFAKENIYSKSKNSAFIGQKMKGKVIGIFNNNQLILNK